MNILQYSSVQNGGFKGFSCVYKISILKGLIDKKKLLPSKRGGGGIFIFREEMI